MKIDALGINQLYHPTGVYKQGSQRMVSSFDSINTTKFVPILLKEWFNLVQKGGLLIIEYQPNNICDKEKLEKMMRWLWNDKYKIVSHSNIGKKQLRFVCKKIISTQIDGDDISKWTFGIITNGKRADWIDQIIKSIRMQKIPHYEIIICGTYPEETEKDVVYIPFNKKDNKGWITKKKNLIVKKAKYENICMLHDRIVLNKGWYQGMKKWGNCFENLGCRQLYNGQRVNDWLTSHYYINNKEGEKFSFESLVDYRDWYQDIWFLGQMNIFKKSIITKNNLWWNENLYYGEREDYDFSLNLHRKGFIHRFNDFSSITTLTNKYNNPTFIKYDPYTIKPDMRLDSLNAFFKFFSFVFLKILHLLGVNLSLHMLENWRGKIYTLILMFGNRKSRNR